MWGKKYTMRNNVGVNQKLKKIYITFVPNPSSSGGYSFFSGIGSLVDGKDSQLMSSLTSEFGLDCIF